MVEWVKPVLSLRRAKRAVQADLLGAPCLCVSACRPASHILHSFIKYVKFIKIHFQKIRHRLAPSPQTQALYRYRGRSGCCILWSASQRSGPRTIFEFHPEFHLKVGWCLLGCFLPLSPMSSGRKHTIFKKYFILTSLTLFLIINIIPLLLKAYIICLTHLNNPVTCTKAKNFNYRQFKIP